MAWADVTACYRALMDDAPGAAPLESRWRDFADAVAGTRRTPPGHLRLVLESLDRMGPCRAPEEIVILDHGCGGGRTLLYLLALGYRQIHGVDLGGPIERLNAVAMAAGLTPPRFFAHDGTRLPLPDASVDLIFSQQVLEHVADRVVEAYYAEEGRVLTAGGVAVHQVPHRLVPYDSHTRTWFLHYFPPGPRRVAYRWLDRDPDYVESMLHLRWPSYHRAQMRRHVGGTRDLTLRRLREVRDFDTAGGPVYDGPRRLRRLLEQAIDLPVAGRWLGAVLRNFVMIDSVSVKE